MYQRIQTELLITRVQAVSQTCRDAMWFPSWQLDNSPFLTLSSIWGCKIVNLHHCITVSQYIFRLLVSDGWPASTGQRALNRWSSARWPGKMSFLLFKAGWLDAVSPMSMLAHKNVYRRGGQSKWQYVHFCTHLFSQMSKTCRKIHFQRVQDPPSFGDRSVVNRCSAKLLHRLQHPAEMSSRQSPGCLPVVSQLSLGCLLVVSKLSQVKQATSAETLMKFNE